MPAPPAPNLNSCPTASPTRTRPRRRTLAALTVAGALTAALGLAEVTLRLASRFTPNAQPQQLTDGFLAYDESLGWRLSARWQGQHRYAGFTANYSTDDDGFRQSPTPRPTEPSRPIRLFVGDSFTFGIGVNDDQTFVAQLNRRLAESPGAKPAGRPDAPDPKTNLTPHDLNLGVPGYSTDQEVLTAERALDRHPAVAELWLVVCLANDLLDNPRAFPLQAQMAKPRFSYDAGSLAPPTNPVPRTPKPASNPALDLAQAIAGPDWRPDFLTRASHRSALALWIHRDLLGARHPPADFAPVQQPNLALFWALTDRLAARCRSRQIHFGLILMPGRAAVHQPRSLPGQYERWLADQLAAEAPARGWPVIDLLPTFDAAAGAATPLFLGDGHLSPHGHTIVADTLHARLGESRSP